MTKNTTVEKIDEIINKIDENLSKKLNQDETQKLLGNIDSDLIGVKKSAEEKHKKIIEEKVKEVREKIDESIGNEDGWGKVKILLKNEIKVGLEEFKKEIEELEKPLQVVPFNKESNPEGFSLIVPANRTESEELVAWKKYFRGQSPEVVFKHVEGLEKFFMETNSTLKETKLIDKIDVQKLSESISGSAETYLKLAKQTGDASGLGLFITPAASIAAMGGAITHGFVVAGAGIYETTREGMKDYAETTQGQISEHVLHHADNATELTGKVIENFNIFGAIKNISSNMGKDIKETEKAREERRTRVAEAEAKARVERLEDLEKQLETLRKEKDNQIKEIKEEKEKQIKRLEEEIDELKDEKRELKARVKELEKKVETGQERLLVAEIEMSRSRASSPVPGYNNNN